MRALTRIAAVAALFAFGSSGAQAKVVQVSYIDTEASLMGIPSFDPQLGHLVKATLDVDVTKYRLWQVNAPSLIGQTVSVTWSIDSLYGLWGYGVGDNSYDTFPITGTGTALVPIWSDGYAQFETLLKGSATFNLDKKAVIGDGTPRLLFTGDDLGLNNPSGDKATLDLPDGASAFQLLADCGSMGNVGDDFCGRVVYKVTYSYNPSAVPEPASWMLVIEGIGALGFVLRRRGSQPLAAS